MCTDFTRHCPVPGFIPFLWAASDIRDAGTITTVSQLRKPAVCFQLHPKWGKEDTNVLVKGPIKRTPARLRYLSWEPVARHSACLRMWCALFSAAPVWAGQELLVPVLAKLLQMGRILCDPMDCSPPGSFVLGIFQARILEWVATPASRGSSRPRDRTCISYVCCIGTQVLYH